MNQRKLIAIVLAALLAVATASAADAGGLAGVPGQAAPLPCKAPLICALGGSWD